MDIQSLKDSYLSARHEADEKDLDINQVLNAIAALQKRHTQLVAERNSLPFPSWVEYLAIPLVKELVEKYPHLEWEFDSRGLTTGLRCQWWCFASDPSLKTKTDLDEGTVVALCFTHGDLTQGEIRIDTGEMTESYPKNTLGEINGMNNVRVPVHSFEQLIEIVERQLKENSH